jgi:hypothetical protein
LKQDKRAIFSAASHAQRAADYLGGLQASAQKEAAWGSRNGGAKCDGNEPVESERVVVARFVQAIGLIGFVAFSRLTG